MGAAIKAGAGSTEAIAVPGGGESLRADTQKIRVCNVSKQFVVRGVRLLALADISFTVADGRITVLTGRSGCGKTTLLRIIMGLETPTAGWIDVDSRRIDRPGQDRGMVFQQAQLLPWRTVLDNVTFGLEVQKMPRKGRQELAEYYLELVGLKDYYYLRPLQLSGGMQQRVGIARALAIQPQVLLMDEPFGSLDAQTRENLQESLLEVHERTKKTILFVTHDLDEAVLLADKVVIMTPSPGRVHEIVDINIPRPRKDIIGIRGGQEYLQKRYYIWKTLKAFGVA